MFVGYKRLKIQLFSEDGAKNGEPIVVEGKAHEGATTTAEITGLAKDPVKVAGSNIDYYLSRQGLGDAKVALGILDLPEAAADKLAGFRVDEDKISYGGEDTLPPYCAIEMESKEDTGEIALLGFFKGTFTRDKISFETLDSQKSFTPEADAWTFTPVSSVATATNGEVMQKFVGDTTTDATTITKFEKQLFDPTATTDPGTDSEA